MKFERTIRSLTALCAVGFIALTGCGRTQDSNNGEQNGYYDYDDNNQTEQSEDSESYENNGWHNNGECQ